MLSQFTAVDAFTTHGSLAVEVEAAHMSVGMQDCCRTAAGLLCISLLPGESDANGSAAHALPSVPPTLALLKLAEVVFVSERNVTSCQCCIL
jgi:hypothetical protein